MDTALFNVKKRFPECTEENVQKKAETILTSFQLFYIGGRTPLLLSR